MSINDGVAAIRAALGDRLVGLYLYGSAMHGGLRPGSDLDLFAVVDGDPGGPVWLALARRLSRLSAPPGDPSGRRPIDLTVLSRERLLEAQRCGGLPDRAEFVYGEWLRPAPGAAAAAASGDSADLADWPAPAADADLALLIASVHAGSLTLFGPAPAHLLPRPDRAQLRAAIAATLPQWQAGAATDGRNAILALARMWSTLRDGAIVPKQVAAQRMLDAGLLSGPAAAALQAALAAYLGLPPGHAAAATPHEGGAAVQACVDAACAAVRHELSAPGG